MRSTYQLLTLIIINLVLLILSCKVIAAEYVGTEQCTDCHNEQAKAWQGSHHDMAMRHAKPDSVLGDFNNVSLEFRGKTNRFYMKQDQYWVNIEGPDGKFHDYQIKYTFAYEPLQQYMVEFSDGRVQLIPFAWDSRTKDNGGQRWFDLYPQFTQNHQEYFWTNNGQNWNYMCADCHSTDVKKNFDVKTNTYKTSFKEINVGCEACHGPASEHLTWTDSADKKVKFSGFKRNITKSVSNWVLEQGKTTLTPEKIEHSEQTLVCAQCHSRHVQISDKDHVKSKEFGDRYLLSLLEPNLYYPDGQIYDEDFVYGSFLQSKMSKNGVVCSNCHDPHSAKLTIAKESVCLQCHLPKTYASEQHHHHKDDSAGAQCVSCHMPETTYMQVDDRADHAWHIPRPDIAEALGTPDTCLSCHTDKTSQWSKGNTEKWYPDSTITSERHFAPVFAGADRNMASMATPLSQIAQNTHYSDIVRASALARMQPFADTNTLIAIARGAKSPDSTIRVGAIRGAIGIRGAERWRVVAPLLADKVLSVRTEAALALIPLWSELSAANKEHLTPALNEYIDVQNFNSDRGYAHTNKGNVYTHQALYNKAESAYKEGIRIEPIFANAYINLADLFRRQNQDGKAISVLEQGMRAIPDNGNFAYSIGLAHIRKKQTPQAIERFKQAIEIEPENENFHYVYGLSVESTSKAKAQQALQKAYEIGGNPQYLYGLCDMLIRHKAFQAKHCLSELATVAPKNVVDQLQQKLDNNK
ncbi:multiheme c-type cytochrome [Thalassotalea psychrophila]|uniref:Multiheme c-type cytochrome n=1 Tax=Thalassotalea psychrophila TaxID=3065647 RepID=A0ABY9U034_9GAMM|nr:multiheme c-type cytochrome [Colwelliaceae bacterium SQ149]